MHTYIAFAILKTHVKFDLACFVVLHDVLSCCMMPSHDARPVSHVSYINTYIYMCMHTYLHIP